MYSLEKEHYSGYVLLKPERTTAFSSILPRFSQWILVSSENSIEDQQHYKITNKANDKTNQHWPAKGVQNR
jgi:hypothetical protein